MCVSSTDDDDDGNDVDPGERTCEMGRTTPRAVTISRCTRPQTLGHTLAHTLGKQAAKFMCDIWPESFEYGHSGR